MPRVLPQWKAITWRIPLASGREFLLVTAGGQSYTMFALIACKDEGLWPPVGSAIERHLQGLVEAGLPVDVTPEPDGRTNFRLRVRPERTDSTAAKLGESK